MAEEPSVFWHLVLFACLFLGFFGVLMLIAWVTAGCL